MDCKWNIYTIVLQDWKCSNDWLKCNTLSLPTRLRLERRIKYVQQYEIGRELATNGTMLRDHGYFLTFSPYISPTDYTLHDRWKIKVSLNPRVYCEQQWHTYCVRSACGFKHFADLCKWKISAPRVPYYNL